MRLHLRFFFGATLGCGLAALMGLHFGAPEVSVIWLVVWALSMGFGVLSMIRGVRKGEFPPGK
jgi:hypothetical protein